MPEPQPATMTALDNITEGRQRIERARGLTGAARRELLRSGYVSLYRALTVLEPELRDGVPGETTPASPNGRNITIKSIADEFDRLGQQLHGRDRWLVNCLLVYFDELNYCVSHGAFLKSLDDLALRIDDDEQRKARGL